MCPQSGMYPLSRGGHQERSRCSFMNNRLIFLIFSFYLGQYGVGRNSNVDRTAAAVVADVLRVDRMTAVRLRPPGR